MLTHRGVIARAAVEVADGTPSYNWSTVAEGVPCLLSVDGAQTEARIPENEKSGRVGTLFALVSADLRPGDRVTFSRGPAGTFEILNPVGEAVTLHVTSHREYRVSEVPGP